MVLLVVQRSPEKPWHCNTEKHDRCLWTCLTTLFLLHTLYVSGKIGMNNDLWKCGWERSRSFLRYYIICWEDLRKYVKHHNHQSRALGWDLIPRPTEYEAEVLTSTPTFSSRECSEVFVSEIEEVRHYHTKIWPVWQLLLNPNKFGLISSKTCKHQFRGAESLLSC